MSEHRSSSRGRRIGRRAFLGTVPAVVAAGGAAPALGLKAGFVDRMPASIMITGRLYDEATLLRVALAYERGTGWKEMHPALPS
jgi:Asp-tRNA(Asn)/Glu-tRNA(Gln) amidotransferase A subunit family amidase